MKRTIIRNEKYGLLVFVPDDACYYRIYDENLKKLLLDGVQNKEFNKIKDEYSLEYKKLKIYNPIFIDNTLIEKNVFVPLEAYFDYTSKCNLNCHYCYNKKYLNNSTMQPEIVRKIISDFASLGISRVHLAGGEPTIDYYGLKNYLEECKEKNLILSMATNGTLLSDKICDLLTSNDLLSISVSLDNAIEAKNDETRGKKTYTKIIDGIQRLNKYKAINNSDVELCFKPVYYPNITKEEINNLIKISLDLGIQKLKFSNPERCLEHENGYYGRIKQAYYNSASLIQECINENKSELLITNITNPYLSDFAIGIEENKGCIGAQELITINPDGRITPCLMNHTNLGNIYNYDSLKDFLENSVELHKYYELISNYDCNCNIYSACRGGCQVRKIVEYGNILLKDPLCPMGQVNKKTLQNEKIRKVNVYHSL